ANSSFALAVRQLTFIGASELKLFLNDKDLNPVIITFSLGFLLINTSASLNTSRNFASLTGAVTISMTSASSITSSCSFFKIIFAFVNLALIVLTYFILYFL